MEIKHEIGLVRENMAKVMVGEERVTTLLLTSLLAGGHVLLEDMPGTGKTMTAKALSKSMEAEFSRIQFTPDLLPSDVTGLNIYHQKTGKFEFHEGPVFCNILLSDEINRATPRTQSALLECMEERQVTVDGVTRKLPEMFMVIATQNPIETAGTFPLPEAQLDRFLFKLHMNRLSEKEEIMMLSRYERQNPISELKAVCKAEVIVAAREDIKQVFIHDELIAYIQKICDTTRKMREILVGVSPRGALSLLRAAKAYAYIQGRDYVVPEDIKEVAVATLAHRIILQSGYLQKNVAEETITKILQTVPVPTEEWKQ